MQSVAPDRLEVLEVVDEASDDGEMFRVVGRIHGVGLGDTDDAAVFDLIRLSESDRAQLTCRLLDELAIRRRPDGIAFETEILEPEARLPGIRHHLRTPVLEILDAADPDGGVMNVDPIVGEDVGALEDEDDRQEIAIRQLLGSGQHLGRRRWIDLLDRFRHGDAGDKVGAWNDLADAVADDNDAVDSTPGSVDRDDVRPGSHHSVAAFDRELDGVPHHARAESGIVEVLDQRLDGRLGLPKHAEERRLQRQVLDPLRGPLGFQLGAGKTPDFLGVRLEEDLEETLAEPVCDPLLEGVFLLIGGRLPPDITAEHADALPDPETEQRIEWLQWVRKELAGIVNPGHSRAPKEVGAEDLVPYSLHRFGFREEAVAAGVEIEALVGSSARKPADDRLLFEHDRDDPPLRELVCRGEAGRPRSENDGASVSDVVQDHLFPGTTTFSFMPTQTPR